MLEGHLAGGVLGDGVDQRKSPGWTNNPTANGHNSHSVSEKLEAIQSGDPKKRIQHMNQRNSNKN